MAKGKLQDIMPNKQHVVVTWAAATTTAVYTTIEVFGGPRSERGMLISKIEIRPRQLMPTVSAISTDLRFQARTGEQTALAPHDDQSVIGTLDAQRMVGAAGDAGWSVWPLLIPGPYLFAERKLTCLMDGNVDAAPFQTLEFLFTIWFRYVGLTPQDWLEIKEQGGTLN